MVYVTLFDVDDLNVAEQLLLFAVVTASNPFPDKFAALYTFTVNNETINKKLNKLRNKDFIFIFHKK